MADLLGTRYDQPMISIVERGKSALLWDGDIRAAQVLNVFLDWLAGLKDEPAS